MPEIIRFHTLPQRDYYTREAFNSLYANLRFSGADVKTVLFTSATPNEGKSTVTVELACTIAQEGRKVLLIDADLRKSVLVGRYDMQREGAGEILGLSHYLTRQKPLEDVLYTVEGEGFDMILSGRAVPNPTALFGSSIFVELLAKMRQEYDVVLVDCPPLGSVIDAATIAPYVDGAVIIAAAGMISRNFLLDVKKQLDLTGCRVLGVVLNKAGTVSGKRYGKYGKYAKYGRYGRYGRYGKYYGQYGGRYGRYGAYGAYGEENSGDGNENS